MLDKNRDFLLTFSMFVLGVYLQMLAINEPTHWLVQIASSTQKFRSQPDRGTGPVGSWSGVGLELFRACFCRDRNCSRTVPVCWEKGTAETFCD